MTKNKYIESKYYLITNEDDISFDNKEMDFKVINIGGDFRLTLGYSQMKIVEGGLEIRIKLGTIETPDSKIYKVYNMETKETIEITEHALCVRCENQFVEIEKSSYNKLTL